MPRRNAKAVWLLMTTLVAAIIAAQPPGLLPPNLVPPQSPEPPLADGATPPQNAVQQAAAVSTQPMSPYFLANAPVVNVRLRAPAVVAPNKEVTYRIHVENSSSQPAYSVTVLFPVPPGATVAKTEPKATEKDAELSWPLGKLDGGGQKELMVVLQPAPDARELSASARVRFEHGQQVKTKIARPEIAIRRLAPTQVQQFDVVSFRLEVSNSAMEPADVKVTETLPEGLTHQYEQPDPKQDGRTRSWSIARLGPGQTRVLEYRAIADRVGAQPIVAQAEATNGAKGEAKGTLTVVEPKLELLASGPGQKLAHQPAKYRFTVRNFGQSPMQNVLVSSQFPKTCKVEGISDAGRLIRDEVQWIIPFLAVNNSRTIELTLRAPAGGEVTQQVSATYRGAKQQTSVTTRFDANADLKWEVKGAAATVEVGREVKYTLTVRNEGSAPAVNVRPSITLPEQMSFVAGEPRTHSQEGQRVTFPALTIPPGESREFTIAVKATRPVVAGQVLAELAADAYPAGPLRKQVSVSITAGGQTTAQGK